MWLEGCFHSLGLFFAFGSIVNQFCARKHYFVFITENLNVLTREVTVFREIFFLLMWWFHATIWQFLIRQTLRMEGEWLAGSIKFNFQIYHNSFCYPFSFLTMKNHRTCTYTCPSAQRLTVHVCTGAVYSPSFRHYFKSLFYHHSYIQSVTLI